MPHQGESASFFSLHFFFLIAIARQVSPPPPPPAPPFLLSPRSPVPSPHRIAWRVWAGEVSTQEPKLSTSSESPRPRASASELGAERGFGGRATSSQRQRRLSSLGKHRASRRCSRLQLRQMLPEGGSGRRDSPVLPRCQGRPRRSVASGRLCPAPGPARAQSAGAPREPERSAARPPPARPPALCRPRLGHRRVCWHPGA